MLAATMKKLKELEGGNKLHAMEVHRRQKMAIFVPVCRTLNKRSGSRACGTPHPLPGTQSDALMCVVDEELWANECVNRRNLYIPPFAVRFFYSSQKTWKSGFCGTSDVSFGVERDFLCHPKKQALENVAQYGEKSAKLTP